MQSISQINSQLTKAYLTEKKENQYFERKGIGEKDTKPSKIAEELIGMLNADGGVLAFGIADNGTLQNLHDIEQDLPKYRSLVFDYIHPACNIELEEVQIDGHLIFLYHVEQDTERVFSRKDNDKIYLRVLDSNRELSRDQVKKLEYDKNIRKFEEETEKDFDVEDFDTELLEDFKKRINYKGDVLSLLSAKHLSKKTQGEIFYKKSAVLLFAKDPEKYIPSASLRYIRYEGTNAQTGVDHNVVKDVRFENNIPKLIDEVKTFLKTTLKDYHFLNIETGKFNKVPEYPEDAWLEGIVNALCHRSYNIQGSSVYIRHYDDRMEISNSGPLPAQVTIENIKTERFARNPRVARVLEDLGYVRQLNEGVSRIYESMEKSMLSEPEYREMNSNVYLTLRNKISGHSKTISDTVMEMIEADWEKFTDKQIEILKFLFRNNKATLSEFANNIDATEKTLRGHLNDFIARGILIKLTDKQRDINAPYVFKKD